MALTYLVMAVIVALFRGIGSLTLGTFMLPFLGGLIWAVSCLAAFTGTDKIGMAKAFGIWAPMNIVVSIIWGMILFGEFLRTGLANQITAFISVLVIIIGILLIIFAGESGNIQRSKSKKDMTIGLIGAGLFANTTLLPALKKVPGVNLRGVATATGLSGHHTGTKFGFEYATTDYHGLLNDPEIDCILIATRHHLHACLVMEALQADKHVFVEKPLALNEEELREIVRAYREANQRIDESTNAQTRNSKSEIRKLMVGFNRRFSPFSVATKDFFAGWQEPLVINCRVNAGFIPGDSWVHDPLEGGGRIIGEVCHFVDLIQYLAGVNPVRVYAETPSTSGAYRASDNVVISLKLADGAVATITYTAAGDKGFPRERIEVFGGGTVAVIDNFKSATFVRAGKTRRMRKWWSVDRGHQTEMEAFVSAIRNGREMPVPFEDYVSTTLTTFMIEESLVKGMPIPVSLGILDLLEDAS